MKDHQVDVIDLSKREFRQGVSSGGRVRQIIKILWRIWRKRKNVEVIYLTVSESVAGNLKDLFIYLLCLGQLGHMVIHLHGGAGFKRIMLAKGRVLRDLNAFFLRRLGGVIVLGKTHKDIYQGVVPEERIHIVPNFAEDSLFTSLERVDSKFLRPNPLRVLFLSNLLPGKGHDELVEAFLALDDETKSLVELHLAGAFESERQKQKFLARLAGVEKIRYHGTVADKQKKTLLDQAHVFCLPTYYPYEGQPISILEAYASGCAVITTDHSGIRDVFQDEVNGFQVAPRSVADLRLALKRAVAEPVRLRSMAATNLSIALASYRTSAYKNALVQIIHSVAGEG